MHDFEYCAPTRIVFGRGAENRTGELAKACGAKRVLVVYGGGSAKRSGLLARTEESLRGAGLETMEAGGVSANPLLSKTREIIRTAEAFRADFILAVGGGSVIDTAKAAAHGAANPETDVWDFWTGKAKVCRSLPVGAVLTIAAAGSETSDSSVLTNDEAEPFTKRGITTQFNRCAFAVMNPELTMTLPAYQIGAGAADIFMHTAERYFTPLTGNCLTDEIAEGLFRDIIRFGPAGVKNPHDYDAMSEIMWCGSVSHVGLTGLGARGNTSRDGDWACHQLGMAISALRNSTHGATLTAVWGAWARFVCGENPARFAQFGRRVFGIAAPDDDAAAAQAIEKSEAFFRSLGMPVSLTELFGSTPGESELAAFAENCSYGRSRTIGSFKVLGYDEILAVYRAAV